jgi:superfamily II DNA or RNA helicase
VNAPLFPPAAVAEPRTLRLYQQTALDLLRESLRTRHRRPILQLPTGAGKTRIAAEIVLGSLSKERHAIFVVPRLSLIEQTVASFEREGVWNIGVIQGQHFRTNANAPVQIASAQTLARREIPPADVVIVDECHLQFKSITEWIADPEWQGIPFIGLSATPWAKGLSKSYDDLLMPVSIRELIEEGYLSAFRIFAPPAPDLSNVRTVAGDFHEADLSEACDTKEIVADIIKTWFEKGENRPTLCYGVDRKHAQHLQERFTEAGVRTEYIDCDTKLFDREEIFERFRASETKLICNVATLDTGIDLDVRCIIDARPTRSRIRFVQKGRHNRGLMFALVPLNKQDEETGRLIRSIEHQVVEAKKRLAMVQAAEAGRARAAAAMASAPVRDKLFEIACPDGRKVRHRGASQEDVQRRLQVGYSVVGQVHGADADGNGGFIPRPGFLTAVFEAYEDELMAFLVARGIVGSDKQVVIALPANGRESRPS